MMFEDNKLEKLKEEIRVGQKMVKEMFDLGRKYEDSLIPLKMTITMLSALIKSGQIEKDYIQLMFITREVVNLLEKCNNIDFPLNFLKIKENINV